ncbi:hypothetical protein, partial [Aneurinibacillus danicus]|uniref:hypothetical protein n=1 Tax=Aneurinibacillus danicus TaxID=267746 RepID=UPI0011BF8F30
MLSEKTIQLIERIKRGIEEKDIDWKFAILMIEEMLEQGQIQKDDLLEAIELLVDGDHYILLAA